MSNVQAAIKRSGVVLLLILLAALAVLLAGRALGRSRSRPAPTRRSCPTRTPRAPWTSASPTSSAA